MAHVLVHTAVMADLAGRPEGLPRELADALREDLVYGRFGAVLPNLPRFDVRPRAWLTAVRGGASPSPPFATLLHNGAPVAVGLRLAELVAGASLVGHQPGLAILAGYFSHLAVDRTLCPPVHDLARRFDFDGATPAVAVMRIERLQAYTFVGRREGREVPGWPGVSGQLQILKRHGFPVRGVGRGLHLLVRTAVGDILGPAPEKAELDRWVRGLYLYGRLLGSHLGGPLAPGLGADLLTHAYRASDFDFEALYHAALERVRHHVTRAFEYLVEGDYGRAARERFFEEIPEGGLCDRP